MSSQTRDRPQGGQPEAREACDGRPRALIVADETLLRVSLQHAVERRGYRAFAVRSARRALAIMEELSFDIAVLEVAGDGVDVLEALRRRSPEARAALVTDGAASLSAPAAIRFGAVALLQKPFDFDELLGVLIPSE